MASRRPAVLSMQVTGKHGLVRKPKSEQGLRHGFALGNGVYAMVSRRPAGLTMQVAGMHGLVKEPNTEQGLRHGLPASGPSGLSHT